MKNFKRNGFLLLISLVSVLLVSSPYISPDQWWISPILAHFAIPVILAYFVLLPFYLLNKNWTMSLISTMILGLGISVISRMYVISSIDKEVPIVEKNKFRVLSYNSSFFKVGHVFSDQYYSSEYNMVALNMKDWLSKCNADIICLQEFFDDANSEIFNTIESLERDNQYDHRFLYNVLHENGIRRGIITFSKFPITNQGTIFLSDNRYNGAMYTDVKIANDTLRIINVHLESYNLLEKSSLVDKFQNFKSSSSRKNDQVKVIIENIRSSPYRVIVCGDFNAPPYSFIYNQFRKELKNSFEQVGNGFGSTYSGVSVLPPLRIDHQFAHPSINVLSFVPHKEITYSEHIPIEALYAIPAK